MLVLANLSWVDFLSSTKDLFVWYYFLFAFLVGSIPSGVLVGRWFGHIDVRQYGSGNIGATNVVRLLGKKAGFLTFGADFLKGTLMVVAGVYFFPQGSAAIPLLGGILAVLGHTRSVFLKFKGGKGVATFFWHLARAQFSIAFSGFGQLGFGIRPHTYFRAFGLTYSTYFAGDDLYELSVGAGLVVAHSALPLYYCPSPQEHQGVMGYAQP